ncbi:hypothetical protein V6N11_027826 [Hibiscus sabdariffa]|uniref:CASP-like protein n=1 Tax=Hibiscus sabdariffa TaxID=183260 RepID=A0ABR2NYX2_9ROSI
MAMKRNQNPNDIMKRSSSSNSNSNPNPESMSYHDSPHSPFRLHSPIRSDQGDPDNTSTSNYASPESFPVKPPLGLDHSKALVAIDKSSPFNAISSPFFSPPPPPTTPPQHSLHLTVNRAVREEGPGATTRTKVGGGVAAVLRRSKIHHKVIMAALGFRLCEIIVCLISFSVMAADKTQGWSGDSYDRYKEYRYCLSVNVIGFVYAGFQAYDVAHYLILAYLLISASSAAASRVDDWQSNWGKDEFTEMATASIAMAFLAFVAFAFSSLISGYELWTHESI